MREERIGSYEDWKERQEDELETMRNALYRLNVKLETCPRGGAKINLRNEIEVLMNGIYALENDLK